MKKPGHETLLNSEYNSNDRENQRGEQGHLSSKMEKSKPEVEGEHRLERWENPKVKDI